MGLFSIAKAIEKRIDRFVWGKSPKPYRKPPPRGVVRRELVKEWNVLFHMDGDIRPSGTVRAAKWPVAMQRARKLAKGKNVDRIQVKVKR